MASGCRLTCSTDNRVGGTATAGAIHRRLTAEAARTTARFLSTTSRHCSVSPPSPGLAGSCKAPSQRTDRPGCRRPRSRSSPRRSAVHCRDRTRPCRSPQQRGATSSAAAVEVAGARAASAAAPVNGDAMRAAHTFTLASGRLSSASSRSISATATAPFVLASLASSAAIRSATDCVSVFSRSSRYRRRARRASSFAIISSIARSSFSSSYAARRARLIAFVLAAPLRLSSVVRTWAGVRS